MTHGSIEGLCEVIISHWRVILLSYIKRKLLVLEWGWGSVYRILRRVPGFIHLTSQEVICLFEVLYGTHFNDVYEIYYH